MLEALSWAEALSRSPELMRRVREGAAKELSNWKTYLVKGWDSSLRLRSVQNDRKEVANAVLSEAKEWLLFCHPDSEPKWRNDPFLSPWPWTEVKEWPFSVTLTLNRSEGMTLFCHPEAKPKGLLKGFFGRLRSLRRCPERSEGMTEKMLRRLP